MLFHEKKTFFFLISVLFFSVSSLLAHEIEVSAAVSASGEVRGTVSAMGKPIFEADINIIAANGDNTAKTSSDSKGNFVYSLTEPGRYRILAQLPDGHEAETSVAYAKTLESLAPNSSLISKNTFNVTEEPLNTLITQQGNMQFEMKIMKAQLEKLQKTSSMLHILNGMFVIYTLSTLAYLLISLKKRLVTKK